MQRCQATVSSYAGSVAMAPRPTVQARAVARTLRLPERSRPLSSLSTFPSKICRRVNGKLIVRAESENLPPLPPPPAAPAAPSTLQRLARFGGVAALAAAAALATPGIAEAARSGGRMGGSSFGSRSSSSSGFGSGGYGASAAAGAFRSSGMSSGRASSYRSTPLSGGFGSPAPVATGGIRMNSFFLSPFGFGYGFGMPVYGFGGGGLLSLLFWGTFAVIMIQVVQGVLRNRAGGGDDYSYNSGGYTEGYEEILTVAKVQVGLMANARELQRDLERIADRADTDSPDGLHYILQETVLSLLRNPDYCEYAFAKSKRERCAEDAETAFNQLSMQERTKFQKETRVNVGGRARRSSLGENKPYATGDKELIVVTLLVAADGGFKLPSVSSRTDLREALSMLGAIRADDLLAVEVLWTPEEEDDYFSVEDLALDYPTLVTL